jgi:hypothetical protein
VRGFERGARRTLASLRRTYTAATSVTLAPSAFYDRFTPQLAELMRRLTAHAFARLSGGPSRPDANRHRLLLLEDPGTGARHAAAHGPGVVVE